MIDFSVNFVELSLCLRSGDTAVVGAFWDDGVKVNVPGFCNNPLWKHLEFNDLPSQQLENNI